MLRWFKKKKKTSAEEKIEKITDLLFPPLDKKEDKEGNEYLVDYSVDANLDAALVDLEQGHNDEVSRTTIKKVADKLIEAREILESYRVLSKNSKYFLVEDTDQRKSKLD